MKLQYQIQRYFDFLLIFIKHIFSMVEKKKKKNQNTVEIDTTRNWSTRVKYTTRKDISKLALEYF